MTRILHVLLDLSLLPAGSRIAELGLEDIVAGHRQEPGVDLPDLAPANPVDGGLRSAWPRTSGGSRLTVVDTPPGDPAEYPERVPVCIEQHRAPPVHTSNCPLDSLSLTRTGVHRLQQIGAQQERPAVRQLDVGHLELRVLPGDRRPVLAPVELEGLPGPKDRGTNVPRPVGCCSR